MSDYAPHSVPIETTSLKSSIAYGISSLGTIPVRYNKPRFPALKRRYQGDTQEKRLLNIGNGSIPTMFALANFTNIGKPQNMQLGNHAALRKGVNFSRDSGGINRLTGAYLEIDFTANVYSNSMDDLLLWLTSVIELPTLMGRAEFGDSGSFDITVTINSQGITWTDPIEPSESGSFLDRFYNLEVSFNVRTIAARMHSVPLVKSILEQIDVEGTGTVTTVEIPINDADDWP